MKNKTRYIFKVYKYIITQILLIGVSFLLAIFVNAMFYDLVRVILDIRIIGPLLRIIVNNLGPFEYYIGMAIMLIFVVFIYVLISYRTNKNIANLMESVEIMANGDLDKRINVKSSDDVGKVASNINHIIKQLEDITVEERKAQQTKTDLITNVSHDLRTPLTSIIGYLNLIEEDKYKDEVHLRYYTRIAYEKSKNLNVLINDLFELTKLQNRSLSLNKVDINLVELIGQVISYLEYQISEANVKVRINFSDDRLIVNADPDKLVRVFENLVTNAIKYGNEGKYIDVVTKKDDKFAVVEIKNYGEPIPQADIPFIFDRFYRVEKSRNRNDGGSGLGLAITKNLVEAHDGKIILNSDYGETKFIINLPIED